MKNERTEPLNCREPTRERTETRPVSRRSMLAATAGATTLLAGCEGSDKSASVKNLEVNPTYVCKGSTVTVDWEALGNEVELEIEQGGSTSTETLYDGTYDTQSGTESVTVQEDTEIRVIAKTSEGSADSKKKDVKVVPAGGRSFIFNAQGECIDNGAGPGTVRYRFSADVTDWGSGVRVTSVTVQAGTGVTVAHVEGGETTSIGLTENGSTTVFSGEKPTGEWVIVKNAGELCENSDSDKAGGGSSGDLGMVVITITVACSDA